MRVAIVTLGCKVNQYESQALAEALEKRGHEVVPFTEGSDAVIVNSCTVTHRSDRDTRALARRARRINPAARIVVTGCYAQTEPATLAGLGVDAVVGTGEKHSIPDLLDNRATGVLVGDVADLRALAPAPVSRFAGKARAFLKVQDGCDAFCAYCVVPYARGPSRSLPLDEVRRGLARLRQTGHGEVVLTGVHLGLWGQDLDPPLPFLDLCRAAEAAGIPRVRLSSLEPGELGGELVALLRASDVLCPHLHVPLQSGSDRILAAMGRPYRASEFRDRVAEALDTIPGLCLGLDVIAGFPGEDDAAFRETRELLERMPFAYLHVFPFSPRPGTRAYDLPHRVPQAEIKIRAAALRDLSTAKRMAFYGAHVNSVMPALPEGKPEVGWLALRTRNYIPVRAPVDNAGPEQEWMVRIERLEGRRVFGRLVGRAAAGG
jgi:threonylcarbamoyladenosine tRNA methylthiotransferase MtaB